MSRPSRKKKIQAEGITMAKMGKGMAEPIECGGHHVPTKAPALMKGDFQPVGTFIDEGAMTSVHPSAVSVNSKTGKLQNGEN
jgi:hypothetical protein